MSKFTLYAIGRKVEVEFAYAKHRYGEEDNKYMQTIAEQVERSFKMWATEVALYHEKKPIESRVDEASVRLLWHTLDLLRQQLARLRTRPSFDLQYETGLLSVFMLEEIKRLGQSAIKQVKELHTLAKQLDLGGHGEVLIVNV